MERYTATQQVIPQEVWTRLFRRPKGTVDPLLGPYVDDHLLPEGQINLVIDENIDEFLPGTLDTRIRALYICPDETDLLHDFHERYGGDADRCIVMDPRVLDYHRLAHEFMHDVFYHLDLDAKELILEAAKALPYICTFLAFSPLGLGLPDNDEFAALPPDEQMYFINESVAEYTLSDHPNIPEMTVVLEEIGYHPAGIKSLTP